MLRKNRTSNGFLKVKVEHTIHLEDLVALVARDLDYGNKVTTKQQILNLFVSWATTVSAVDIELDNLDEDNIKKAKEIVSKKFQ